MPIRARGLGERVPGNCSGSVGERGAATLAFLRSLSEARTTGRSVCRALDGRFYATLNIHGARGRELKIAREDIVTRPVEPIPSEEYVGLCKEPVRRYGFSGERYVLAAVGKIESNHGETMESSGAGTMGPMQLLSSTRSPHGTDGNGDGNAKIMAPRTPFRPQRRT